MGRASASRADERHMRRALELAARGAGAVSPNPMVGAVVVRGGRVVGEGYHRAHGRPHAEAVALRKAGPRAKGATLYTNLEPCAHHGLTPPCVDAVCAAGITRVVAAMRDPDPKVRGRGFRRLRAAGVEVEVGLLSRQATELNAAFVHAVRTGRPLVTLKAGMTLDGRIAGRSGESRWITTVASRRRVHDMRGASDAILVGAGTVRADDPRLTARGRRRRQPLRVVLDSRFRTSPDCRLLAEDGGGPVVIYGIDCPARTRRKLEEAGAEAVVVRGRQGRPDLRAVLSDLAARGVRALLVEGGSRVTWSFLSEHLADRVAWFTAPLVLGGGALPVVGGPGLDRPAEAVRLLDVTVSRVGADWLVEGRVRAGKRPR